MFGKILTEDNEFLLKIIFDFGGYIRQSHTEFIYPEISYRARSAKLLKLCEMGYLKQKKLHTNSRREPTIYQVTTKACDNFGKKDSNLRKNHKEEYILRALLKSEFLCRYYRNFSPCIATDNDEKIRIMAEYGCNESVLPFLQTPNQNMPYIDETVLRFEGKLPVLVTESGNVLCGLSENISFVYPDKRTWDIADQVEKLRTKYLSVHGQLLKTIGVSMVIITDSVERQEGYLKAASEFEYHHQETQMRREILKIYINYLAKRKEELFAHLLTEIKCTSTSDLERITARLDDHFVKSRKEIVTIDMEKYENLIEYLVTDGLENIETLIRNSDEYKHLFTNFDELFECVLALIYGAGLQAKRQKPALKFTIECM